MEPRGDIAYWLALNRTPVGPAGQARLLERYQTPQAVFAAPATELAALGCSQSTCDYLGHPDWSCVEADINWLSQPDRSILTLADSHYPSLLRELSDPPPLLYMIGDPALLVRPQIAIVGSRNPSPGGIDTAHEFANQLAQAGLTVTSGLALGIDAAAHRGALDAGCPTIAITGNGLDRVYPARHRDLAHEIAEAGLLATEFPLGTPPMADHFPRRNRVISGLSLGTLVVEAAARSGALITARLAGEQGREVFAVPGSIHSPMSRGCHALIRQGAKLVESVNDIIEELGPLAGVAPSPQSNGVETAASLDDDYQRLLQDMGYEPVTIDTLVERTGLTAEAISSMLLLMELQGFVVSQSGGMYTRTRQGT